MEATPYRCTLGVRLHPVQWSCRGTGRTQHDRPTPDQAPSRVMAQRRDLSHDLEYQSVFTENTLN